MELFRNVFDTSFKIHYKFLGYHRVPFYLVIDIVVMHAKIVSAYDFEACMEGLAPAKVSNATLP
ncbi:hypothetical protein DesyoDRAFT_3936 [Desulfosporosinus youngiae DSM 17734]|uniref:Uncharacterized protein n=1 Tax=Desulfosporosinus youngiae DSM 17734 TaxID=768710 RepID=H5Y5X0_9FIRM|nr:hypothetical protein DesyoDRAFT_3936 [Desulfosporosinus youngiae DSM 17734]